MKRIPHLLAILASCCLVTACGGGAGGGSAGGGTAVETPGAGPGQRAVPGYVLSAERRSTLVAGAPCTVRVIIAPVPGQQAITAVEAWFGLDDYAAPAATFQAAPVSGLANTWEVTGTLPDPLPAEATAWLRLTTSDGSVLEVGRDAFRLATLPVP